MPTIWYLLWMKNIKIHSLLSWSLARYLLNIQHLPFIKNVETFRSVKFTRFYNLVSICMYTETITIIVRIRYITPRLISIRINIFVSLIYTTSIYSLCFCILCVLLLYSVYILLFAVWWRQPDSWISCLNFGMLKSFTNCVEDKDERKKTQWSNENETGFPR